MPTVGQGVAWAVLFVVGGVFAGVGADVYRREDAPGATSFAGFCLVMALFLAIFTVMQVVGAFVQTIADLSELLFVSLTATVILGFHATGLGAPVLWVRFVLRYTGQRVPTTRRTLLFIGAPVLVVVGIIAVAASHPFLGLLGLSLPPIPGDPMAYALTVIVFYLFALLVAGASLVGWTSYNYHHLSTRGGILLGVAGVLPWAAITVPRSTDLFDGAALQYHGAVGSALGACALVAALYRYDLFENVPAAGTIGRDVTVEEMADPVVVVDESHQIVDLNPAARRLFGAGTVGTPIAALFDGDLDLETLFSDSSVAVEFEWEQRVVEATGSRLRNEYGRTLGYSVVFHDVTDRTRRQEQIQVLNRVLRHNLRNDMSVVKAYTEALEGDPPDPREYTDQIKAAADDLVALGEKAREIETLVATQEYRTAPLSSVVREAVDDARTAHPDCTFTVDGSAGDAPVNEPIVGAVLGELLDNGAEHNGSDGPQVELRVAGAAAEGEAVTVRVADNGPGVPDHELAVLRSGTETELEHGSGLGLWLVQWGLSAVAGSVEFDTPEHGGTAVTLEIPTAE